MNRRTTLRAIEATAVLLLFLQAVRVLFSVLFGVIYDAIFEGPITLAAVVKVLLVLLAFLCPLLTPRGERAWRRTLFASALLAFAARIPLTVNDANVRLAAGVLIAAGSLYMATLVRTRPRLFMPTFIAALAGDQLLRTLGHTFDLGLRAWWLPLQAVLSLALAAVAWAVLRRAEEEAEPQARLGILGGLAVGAALFLETSLLDFPNAIARLSGVRYAVVAPLLMLVTLLAWLAYVTDGYRRLQLGEGRRAAWLVLFTLLAVIVGFEAAPPLAAAGLLLAQGMLLLLLGGALRARGEKAHRCPGLGLALGLLLFLLLNFAYAFAFTYAYTLQFFRGMGRPVLFVAVLIVTMAALRRGQPAWPRPLAAPLWQLALVPLLLVILCAAVAWPPSLPTPEPAATLRAATYNIHYGYNTPWQLSLEAQARTIEESGADVVFLQEVDAARITSYGVDNALWLARRLHMREVYLPCVEGLTGIALLSRYPLLEQGGRLLPSEEEQTGIVWARLDTGRGPVNAFGIWLGLSPEERARQLEVALAFIAEHPGPALFGGDFNSTPASPVYERIARAGFVDPFIATGAEPLFTSPAERPASRIDFVWVRDLRPTVAEVLPSMASDHRLVVVSVH
ncbi:MAG: endonuclease/exonuclease/phosphatase family protein [Anaerolineae bacterium]|nr:endonuclease/exonuclease/phosphatase family protein [Anaerolineae bacterium]